MENKAEGLEKLKREMGADKNLPLYGRANLVFGEGDPNAAVVFIGEAPGFHEDRLARPFVGQAGKLLDRLLEDLGWPRNSVYITNIVKRRPPENRDPLQEEIDAYKPYLQRQIEIMDPKIVVTLGRFAMNYFLPQAKMTRDHAVPSEVLTKEGQGFLIFPVYHPAAALRSTQMLKVLEEDFKKLPDLLRNADGFTTWIEAKKPSSQASLF